MASLCYRGYAGGWPKTCNWKARGDVRCVSDRGVVHPQVVTDVSDDHEAAVEAYPDRQLDRLRRARLGPQRLDASLNCKGR